MIARVSKQNVEGLGASLAGFSSTMRAAQYCLADMIERDPDKQTLVVAVITLAQRSEFVTGQSSDEDLRDTSNLWSFLVF